MLSRLMPANWPRAAARETGRSVIGDRAPARHRAAATLPKPVRPAELLAAIDRVVASHGTSGPGPPDAGHVAGLLDPGVRTR